MTMAKVILKPITDDKTIKNLYDALEKSGINKELQKKAVEAKKNGFNGFKFR